METDKMFIPYDIVDNILIFLDMENSKNFLLSSSQIYYNFHGSRHFYICMSKKICEHFSSLSKIKIDYTTLANNDLKQIYTTLNKIYNHFRKHPQAMLSDFLIYLCEYQETQLFEIIISKCYFSKTGEYIYNALRADDISYLLMFYNDLSIITKNIYVDALIILNVIKFKILNKNTKDISFLLNYLLFKHFFRYSGLSINDILTEIVCELIKSNNYENVDVLRMLYHKKKFYRFRLNHQRIINASMQQKYEDVIVLVHENINDDVRPVLISKDYIRLLMKNRYYKVLEKVIELYLGETINLKGYVDEIYYNFDNSKECKKILRFLSEKNKSRFKLK